MIRTLILSLALACVGMQVAPGSAFLAGLLAHEIHGGDHTHAVALVADQGHLHVVLSHDQTSGEGHGDAPRHDDRPTSGAGKDHASPSRSEKDHVFHVASADASNTPPRRSDLRPASAVAVAALPALAPTWFPRVWPEPRAHDAVRLRTIVLRL